MLLGIGIDLFAIQRLAPQALDAKDPFLLRAYTPREREQAQVRQMPLYYYATRFAGKEAVYKAISFCGEEFHPGEIEILNDADGKPHASISGRTAERLAACTNGGAYTVFISLSYDADYASAIAVVEDAVAYVAT
jgi:holo-[acyl-carrier-protein] synthase